MLYACSCKLFLFQLLEVIVCHVLVGTLKLYSLTRCTAYDIIGTSQLCGSLMILINGGDFDDSDNEQDGDIDNGEEGGDDDELYSYSLFCFVAVEYSGIILAREQVWAATHLQARWLPGNCCRTV